MCLIQLAGCGQKPMTSADACDSVLGEQGIIRAAHKAEVLDAPDGQRVRNEAASEATKREVVNEIDSTTPVERICSKGGWTKINATDLKLTGWVRDTDIEPIPHAEDGSRIHEIKEISFMEDDWSLREKAMKPKLIAKFNELSKECQNLESLVMLSPNSNVDAPTFNFTCDDGHPHFIPYTPDAGS